MTTYLPEQISDLLSSNPIVSLGTMRYKATSGNGGCKELLIDGETINIVIPCETRKLETSHRFKVLFFVSQTVYESIRPLCEYISNSLGSDIRPFCWSYAKEGTKNLSYYANGRLITSKSGDMYSKLYTEDGILLENIDDWPSGYVGHVSLRLDGIYIDNLKSRDTKLSYVVAVEEMLVSETIAQETGSKIKKLITSSNFKEQTAKTESDEDIDDLW